MCTGSACIIHLDKLLQKNHSYIQNTYSRADLWFCLRILKLKIEELPMPHNVLEQCRGDVLLIFNPGVKNKAV